MWSWASEEFFPGGSLGDFSKIFPGRPRVVKSDFLPLEIEKTTFFAEIFKTQGWPSPPLPPSDASACGSGKWLQVKTI